MFIPTMKVRWPSETWRVSKEDKRKDELITEVLNLVNKVFYIVFPC